MNEQNVNELAPIDLSVQPQPQQPQQPQPQQPQPDTQPLSDSQHEFVSPDKFLLYAATSVGHLNQDFMNELINFNDTMITNSNQMQAQYEAANKQLEEARSEVAALKSRNEFLQQNMQQMFNSIPRHLSTPQNTGNAPAYDKGTMSELVKAQFQNTQTTSNSPFAKYGL